MFEIEVQSEFCAAHALQIGGVRETLHGHNWRTVATLQGPSLDSDGLLCDFHTVQELLHAILAPFNNRSLNDAPPFDRLNPSAENVARHIHAELSSRLAGLPGDVRVASVSVTEAPGCRATYHTTHDHGGTTR
ncbi:MAG: 6-carboxytetrahydropterin synthase [Phycisphaeraceae bacterium]|nr:MAG: 6-carboxytetrahydropterin synthase [Phycisphaeraceae bacterium]